MKFWNQAQLCLASFDFMLNFSRYQYVKSLTLMSLQNVNTFLVVSIKFKTLLMLR